MENSSPAVSALREVLEFFRQKKTEVQRCKKERRSPERINMWVHLNEFGFIYGLKLT